MNRELVSAIIPSYNCAEYVCEAVESALVQTYANLEVIVVDSGNDDTRNRLAVFGSRIQYIYQPPKGLSAARNLAVRQAKGEWIALLDADDIWHPQKTELQLRAAARLPGCALVSSAAAIALPPTLEPEPRARELSVTDFLLSTPIGPSGTLLRRDALEAEGMFDESLPFVEDRDMWLRLSARFQALLVESPCWWHRTREGQMSRDAARNHENYRRVLEKFFQQHTEYIQLRRAAWSYFYADSAWTHFEEGYRGVALAMMARSLLLHPNAYFGEPPQRRGWRYKATIRYLFGTRFFDLLRSGIR